MSTEVCRYTIPGEQLEASGPHIPILVGETMGAALLDTGARVSGIDLQMARRLGLRESGTRTITGVTGTAAFPAFHTEPSTRISSAVARSHDTVTHPRGALAGQRHTVARRHRQGHPAPVRPPARRTHGNSNLLQVNDTIGRQRVSQFSISLPLTFGHPSGFRLKTGITVQVQLPSFQCRSTA